MQNSSEIITEYLISYGTAGTLGRFISTNPEQSFTRGDRVVLRSERGQELGTVLGAVDSLALPASLRHLPGQILQRALPNDEAQAISLTQTANLDFARAREVINPASFPLELVDLEVVTQPLTYVFHFLQLGDVSLQSVQDRLFQLLQMNILLHDVTNPEARESAAENGCGSCGSGRGCQSKGGCQNGSCGSGCGSKREFPEQWKAYFAELRGKMEAKHGHNHN